MNVQVNMSDAATILRKRGLEPNGRVQQFFTSECARYMDDYIPMQQGTLKNQRVIRLKEIEYTAPYARFHYYGKVMIGIHSRSAWAKQGERKIVTEKDLKHHGAPMRGPFWDKRMWADKKTEILNAVAKLAGGKAQ